MDRRIEPSNAKPRSDAEPANVLGLCFIAQHIKDHLKETLIPEGVSALDAGRVEDEEAEVTTNKDMLIKSYDVRCLKLGCPVVMTCWERTLPGEQTFMNSHSREELIKRGCKVERDKAEYLLSQQKRRPMEPST